MAAGSMMKAVIATLAGFAFLSMIAVFVKLEGNGGASIQWIVLMQYLTCLVIISILAAKNKFRDLKTSVLKYHIIRGITGILAFGCGVAAITKIPLVNASLLNNTAPLFIPIITLLWLKTKIDEKIWYGIVTGFIGIILILRPKPGDLLSEGDMYGIAAGIFLAIAYVSLKILTKTESFITVLFYYSAIATMLSLPFAIMNWTNPPLEIWIYGILTGICFISYLFLIQYSYGLVDAIKLAPFNYAVVVFTGIFDWLIFKNVPGLLSLLGIALVIIGGILAITLHEKDNKHLKHHWHS